MSDDEREEASPRINVSGLGKLPKFDGRSNIKRFLKSIDKRAKLDNWSEENKIAIVQYLCTDLAEAYLDSIPDDDNLTYKELTDSLKARFEPKLSKPEAYSELMAIEQGRSDVNGYAGRIESSAADLTDIIPELSDADERDALLISVFRAGLDPSIQKALVANDYTDFNDIVKAAKRCEAVFSKGRRNINHVQSTNPVNDRQNNQKQFDPKDVECWYCGKRGHKRNKCYKFLARYPQNHNAQSNGHYSDNRYHDSKNQ